MGKRDPRIDTYIAHRADFARPILVHLREVIHEACPDVVETMKWSAPNFDYHGIMCSMAAFKEHCALSFWKGSLIVETDGDAQQAAGQFGRLTKVSDLPSRKILAGYVKKAMELNEEGVKNPARAKKDPKPDIPMPADFHSALRQNKKAKAEFEGFSPSKRREYVEWITQSKSDDTRAKRMATAVDWISEGKARNWKYEK